MHLKRYAKDDRRMRTSLKQKSPQTPALDAWAGESVYELLSTSRTTPEETDHSWFQRRWGGGEREAMEAHVRRVVEEARLVPMGPLGSEDTWTVHASPVMGNTAVAHEPSRQIVVGPRCAGITLAISLVAEKLRPCLDLAGLSPTQQEMVRIHTAGAALLAIQDEEGALDAWLPELIEAILPRPTEKDAYGEDITIIAESLLDQPPGEIERIAVGLCQRRIPRLLRAWRRGFFVPPGFRLEEWMKSL